MRLLRIFLVIALFAYGTALFAETTYYKAVTEPIDPNAPSDATITSNINNVIQNNPAVFSFNIQVTTQEGVVTLSGTVDTLDQAKQLVSSVALVEGVKDVFTDDLFVKTPTPDLSEELMTEKVKGALVREKIFPGVEDVSNLPISVQSVGSIVYLRGVVDTQDQLIKSIQLIQKMRSVPRVFSLLQIRASPVTLE